MYKLSFEYGNETYDFDSKTKKDLYTDIIDWLFGNGYEFLGKLHEPMSRKIMTLDEVRNLITARTSYRFDHFHNICNSGKFILCNKFGTAQGFDDIYKMLENFGIEKSSIRTYNIEPPSDNPRTNQIKRFDEFLDQKYTKLEAAQIVLKQNNNNPMTAASIWNEIVRQNLAKKPGSLDQMSVNLNYHSINSNYRGDWYGKKHKLFMIVEGSPRRFKLVDPESDIVNVSDEDGEDQISTIKIDRSTINQFDTAVCVTGESGIGKSTLVEDLLSEDGHNYEFIIPTSSTTSLLAQYSPRNSSYSPSRLGNLLISAKKNPKERYTAVFDEMHKPAVIDMINDELLQAISKERNQGKRFISVDGDVYEIYKDLLDVDEDGNLLVPNNFGFVFITSKEDVIINNPDLMGRIKMVNITGSNRDDIHTIDDLIDKCDKD